MVRRSVVSGLVLAVLHLHLWWFYFGWRRVDIVKLGGNEACCESFQRPSMEPADFLFSPLCINILLPWTFSALILSRLFWCLLKSSLSIVPQVKNQQVKCSILVTFIIRFFHSMDLVITVSRLDLTFAKSAFLSDRFRSQFWHHPSEFLASL